MPPDRETGACSVGGHVCDPPVDRSLIVALPRADIGAAPLAAALLIGSAGLLVLGVQPLLYAAYISSGAIDESRLGWLASAEVAMLSIGCAIGIALLRRAHTSVVVAVGTVLIVTGNLLPSTVPLIASRAVAGSGGGLLVALAATAIARRNDVDRGAAAFLFLQAATQILAVQLATISGAAVSAARIQQLLVVAALICLPMAALLPGRLGAAPATKSEAPVGMTLAGRLGLGVSGLFVGAVVGVWAYMGLWMESRGLEPAAVGVLLSASLAGQMVGAVLAMAISRAGRSSSRVLVAGIVLVAALVSLLQFGPHGPWAIVFAGLFGLAWMLATPALTGFLAEVDPDRTSLPHAAAAQLLGAALVPTLVGQLGMTKGLDGLIMTFAALVLASLGLLAVVRWHAATGKDGPADQ